MNTNTELELAWQFIENTGSNLFLTGKAGTGKTTFLKNLKEKSPKRMIVVAPTGIAAINAGGVTIHSFFQLPLAPYIPETTFASKEAHYRFGREKRRIISSLDLLVIDEVSMVRADLLDAIDAVLRRYRNRNYPFGGVQLLMIGDMQQLSPVVKDDEWQLLGKYYSTPYFFGSKALKEAEYVTIELEQVYRQSDDHFLSLLNRIRANDVDDKLLDELNKRYFPNFEPPRGSGYIRLTTHNYAAQRINDQQLSLLPSEAVKFKAEVTGVFPEYAYPGDQELILKRGAQIMFIKNDSSLERKYYNGKIGIVTSVSKDGIRVRPDGEAEDFSLEQEEWSNSKFTLNEETKEIVEEVEGVFKQYPIRLAWAITIHKSQGLTFERAIIDANASFAHGQVYVALSRCKTLDGMVLSTPLKKEAIISDETIKEFNVEVENLKADTYSLSLFRRQYYYDLLGEQFAFKQINMAFSQMIRFFDEHLYRLYPKQLERYKAARPLFEEQIVKVADKFQQLYVDRVLKVDAYDEDDKLSERVKSGAAYFEDKLANIFMPLITQTHVDLDNKEQKRRFTDLFQNFSEQIKIKVATLAHTKQEGFSVSTYLKNKAIATLSLIPDEKTKPDKKAKSKKVIEKTDVPSDILHLELYNIIKQWRNNEAAKTGLPVYTVIQQKAILGIVNLLPTTMEELSRIPYLGKMGVEKNGEVLLEMVRGYRRKKGM